MFEGLDHVSTCPTETFNATDGKVMTDNDGNAKMLFPMSRSTFDNVLELATESNHTWEVHCLMTDKKGLSDMIL